MNDESDHEASDAAQRYVAGTLSAEETTAFEQHLLTCAACRDEVRRGAAISASLRGSQAQTLPGPARMRGRGRPRSAPVVAGVALAAAAAVVLIVGTRDGETARLARLDTPPVFEPMPVRAAIAEGEALVDSAMASYAAGEYRTARDRFGRVPATALTTGARFYLGAAALADGAPAQAREPLERVVADSISPFAVPARVLLAKALLGQQLADSALATVAHSMDPQARAFADSIRALARRRRP
jgi:hypothetical protein